MKIKLKKNQVLPSNWKACGHSAEDWENLNNGKSIEVTKVPSAIENYVEVVESATSYKQKKQKGDK